MPQRRIPHPLDQDVDRARELHSQAVLGVNHIVPDRLIGGIHINGVDLAVEGIFDLPTNVSLAYFLAQACYLRCRAGWGVHRDDPRAGLFQVGYGVAVGYAVRSASDGDIGWAAPLPGFQCHFRKPPETTQQQEQPLRQLARPWETQRQMALKAKWR